MIRKPEQDMASAGDKEAAALGRMVHAMSKLIALEDHAGSAVAARETREMEDIRSKLVARIAELKRN
jgi:ABC-type iron transport system FetAB ATPase subunit